MKSDLARTGVWLGSILVVAVIVTLTYFQFATGDVALPVMGYRANTPSGTIEFAFISARRLRAGQQSELTCMVQPRTEDVFQQPKYPLGVFISIGGSTEFDITNGFASLQLRSNEPKSVAFQITPRHSGRAVLFVSTNINGDQSSTEWSVDVAPAQSELVFVAFSVFAVLASLYAATVSVRRLLGSRAQAEALTEKKISEAETKAEQAPEKAKFAWDLARVKLEAYFDRNLSQVNQVFVLAASVMLVGFAFVLFGVVVSLFQPKLTPPAIIAGISGIITQFIGATFLVIYRSTMAQANEFMAVLERINTVGMAIQVLDSIPDEGESELKNSTRAEIVKLLLNANTETRRRRFQRHNH